MHQRIRGQSAASNPKESIWVAERVKSRGAQSLGDDQILL